MVLPWFSSGNVALLHHIINYLWAGAAGVVYAVSPDGPELWTPLTPYCDKLTNTLPFCFTGSGRRL